LVLLLRWLPLLRLLLLRLLLRLAAYDPGPAGPEAELY
jgi:hypothetical protein